jgi:hypothetical protein
MSKANDLRDVLDGMTALRDHRPDLHGLEDYQRDVIRIRDGYTGDDALTARWLPLCVDLHKRHKGRILHPNELASKDPESGLLDWNEKTWRRMTDHARTVVRLLLEEMEAAPPAAVATPTVRNLSPAMSRATAASLCKLSDARELEKVLGSAIVEVSPQKVQIDLDLVQSAAWRTALQNHIPKRREVERSATKRSKARN